MTVSHLLVMRPHTPVPEGVSHPTWFTFMWNGEECGEKTTAITDGIRKNAVWATCITDCEVVKEFVHDSILDEPEKYDELGFRIAP